MLKEFQDIASQAMGMAKVAGADDVQVSVSSSTDTEYRVREGELEKAQASIGRSLDLRLYVDGRYSSHSTTDLRPDRMKSFITEAVALTRALEPDPDRMLAPEELYTPAEAPPDLQPVDTSIGTLDNAKRLEICQSLFEAARHHDAVISVTSTLYDGLYREVSVNSKGLSTSFESTSLWMGTSVTCQDEGDKRPRGGMWAGGRHWMPLPSPEAVGKLGLQYALDKLGMAKGPTREGLMVVHPRVAGSLISRLLSPASGSQVQQQRSFWGTQMDKQVMSPLLTIIDDPLIPQGQASRYHDSEGIASRPMTLIEEGRFKGLYIDTYYGRKMGVAPTTGNPSNRVVSPGERDLAAILKDVDSAILVTGWLGGNSDPSTGDFSMGCQGNLVENGVIGAPIGEMNVTGNLVTLFAQLQEVGNDPWPYSAIAAPTLVFDAVDFSGV